MCCKVLTPVKSCSKIAQKGKCFLKLLETKKKMVMGCRAQSGHPWTSPFACSGREMLIECIACISREKRDHSLNRDAWRQKVGRLMVCHCLTSLPIGPRFSVRGLCCDINNTFGFLADILKILWRNKSQQKLI